MDSRPPAYVDVAFPDIAHLLTYAVPEAWHGMATPGKRVLVPLGRRTATGYLVRPGRRPPVAEVKPLQEVLDPEPLLDPGLLALTEWVANYYVCSWGDVIRTALPPGIDTATRQVVRLTPAGAALGSAAAMLRPGEDEVLALLRARGTVLLSVLTRRWPEARRLVHTLARRGLLEMAGETRAARVRPLAVAFCRLAPGVTPEVALPARAAKQRAILQRLAEAPRGLPKSEAAGGSPSALATLIKQGLVQVVQVEVSRDPFAAVPEAPIEAPLALAPGQAEAVRLVEEALAPSRFLPLLLHGVTGSGKTEVYLQAIQTALALGRQALVLVPEISLTPLTVRRFLARFGGRVAVLHSGLAGGERYDAWRRIRGGGAEIVIGARSAVFAPLPRLGILVVDEEHDPSYKQEESPRYHGRDVAVMRAKQLGVPVILGSATPSLESYERARAGRYRLAQLAERIEARPLPRVEVVDLRTIAGGERLLSPPLLAALADRLAKREQSLLFLNRRGFSTLLLCQECGATVGCPHCSVSLTYHAGRGRLRCHTCDFERRPPERCPGCQGTRLRYLGFGTQQVEAAVREHFPTARVSRMDRDNTRSWQVAGQTLEALGHPDRDADDGQGPRRAEPHAGGRGLGRHGAALAGLPGRRAGLRAPHSSGRPGRPGRAPGSGAHPDVQSRPLHPPGGAGAGLRHAVGSRGAAPEGAGVAAL